MKLNYQIVCLFLLISSYIAEDWEKLTPSNADDCKDDSILETDKNLDYTHCCLYERENLDVKTCRKLTTRQYKNIGNYIKMLEEGNDYNYKLKIDCNSFHLKFYLLSLILFLIWLRLKYFK